MQHKKTAISVILSLLPVGPHNTTRAEMKSSVFWNISPCSPLKINWHVPLKCRFTFSRLHGIIFQTRGIFITTFVWTSNHTKIKYVYPRLEYICFQNVLFCNLMYIIHVMFIYCWYTAVELKLISTPYH